MKLKNPFTNDTRWLFFDIRYSCYICGRNNTELHHIAGRVSSSPLNASVLCKVCHNKINHSEQEEIFLFKKTLLYLKKIGYNLSSKDYDFIEKNKRLQKAIRSTNSISNM